MCEVKVAIHAGGNVIDNSAASLAKGPAFVRSNGNCWKQTYIARFICLPRAVGQMLVSSSEVGTFGMLSFFSAALSLLKNSEVYSRYCIGRHIIKTKGIEYLTKTFKTLGLQAIPKED